MGKTVPTEICEYLGFRVSEDYKLVRLSRTVFNETRNELTLTFLYDESIKSKIEWLKARLEQEFKSSVDLDVKYIFEYKCSFIDTERLGLLIRVFLQNNFSMLTLDLDDDDIIVKQTDRMFDVNVLLQKYAADYVRASKSFAEFLHKLKEEYFYGFSIDITPKKEDAENLGSIEDIEAYVKANMKDTKISGVDKTCRVKNVEYILGKPIKEKPIKIEYLAVSPDEQVIAGTINFLTKREYTKKDTEEKKPYWTFVIDDGSRRHNCVFFPNSNTLAKFDKLTNGTVVCLLGVNDERNGRTNFSVKGVSFCEMA